VGGGNSNPLNVPAVPREHLIRESKPWSVEHDKSLYYRANGCQRKKPTSGPRIRVRFFGSFDSRKVSRRWPNPRLLPVPVASLAIANLVSALSGTTSFQLI
jgi:hypothetical protein